MISWKTIGFGLLMVIVVISVIPSAFAQTLLQITSPLSGLPYFPLYTEGQTYTITLSADPSVSNIAVMTPPSFPDAQPTSNPAQFTLTLPTNITPGIYSIGAMGFTSSGDVEASPVQIDVERADVPVSLTVEPISLQLQGIGDQLPLSVWGTYNDGTTLFLSNSTELSYKSKTATVVTVSGQLSMGDGPLPPIGPLTGGCPSIREKVLSRANWS
jgi:hypothetical protein